MLKKIIVIIFIASMLMGCKTDYDKVKNFNVFKKILNDVIVSRNKENLDKILAKDFRYILGDERDNYSREEVISNFDFDLVESIIKEGYEVDKNNTVSYSPPLNKVKKYMIQFYNKGDGWKIQSIYTGNDESYIEQ